MEPIKLPAPREDGGMPLLKAIKERKSQKDYNPGKELSLQQISEILYLPTGLMILKLTIELLHLEWQYSH